MTPTEMIEAYRRVGLHAVEPVATAYPKGARVSVTDELLEGEGIVVIPVVAAYSNSFVGVEFDGAPGFVWHVRRDDVVPV